MVKNYFYCSHIDGLATGVTSIVKGCLVRPLQERWAGMPSACTSANTFRINNFEARYNYLKKGIRVTLCMFFVLNGVFIFAWLYN